MLPPGGAMVTSEAVCIGELARDLSAMEDPQADRAGAGAAPLYGTGDRGEVAIDAAHARTDRRSSSTSMRPGEQLNLSDVPFAEALDRLYEVVRYPELCIAAAHDAMPAAMCGVILTVSAFSLRLL
jgi:hypothetical protein